MFKHSCAHIKTGISGCKKPANLHPPSCDICPEYIPDATPEVLLLQDAVQLLREVCTRLDRIGKRR